MQVKALFHCSRRTWPRSDRRIAHGESEPHGVIAEHRGLIRRCNQTLCYSAGGGVSLAVRSFDLASHIYSEVLDERN